MESIIDSIKKYMEQFPYEEKTKIKIDFLKDDEYSCSIEPVPTNRVIEHYIGGLTKKQFPFIFAIVLPYSVETKMNLTNSGFFEKLENWIETNNARGILPVLSEDKQAVEINVTVTGFLYGINQDETTARYQMQLNFTYWEKEEEQEVWQQEF